MFNGLLDSLVAYVGGILLVFGFFTSIYYILYMSLLRIVGIK